MKENNKIDGISLQVVQNRNGKHLEFQIKKDNQIWFMDQDLVDVENFLKKCRTTLKDFKKDSEIFIVNDFITLKLEYGHTNIYVNGQIFHQCKYLLLDIPKDKTEELEDIKSIDEASERLDHTLHGVGGSREFEISHEQEFKGHCSNLQAWAENNYDTRLLHRNIAFPLLRKLSKGGDPIAKRIYKDELALRLESGEPNVFEYLSKNKYLEIFDPEELKIIFENIENKIIEVLFQAQDENSKFHQVLEKYNISYDDYDPRFKGISLQGNHILICSYNNNSVKFHDYQKERSIYDQFKWKLAGGKSFLDFGIRESLNNRRVVFSLKHVKLARELLNHSPDIQISIPKKEGPLRIGSREEGLKIYIMYKKLN